MSSKAKSISRDSPLKYSLSLDVFFCDYSRVLLPFAFVTVPNLLYSTLQQCQINDLLRSEASVLLLSFQKKSNKNVFKSKFWIETKHILSVLKIFGPKAFVLFRFQKYFKLSKRFVLISKQLEANKNVPNQQKNSEIVHKTSVLFLLKHRCMETFRSDKKLARFRF